MLPVPLYHIGYRLKVSNLYKLIICNSHVILKTLTLFDTVIYASFKNLDGLYFGLLQLNVYFVFLQVLQSSAA